ncbi:23068_t:CDS:10 [Entrophospora sp. SA101]|nr:8880_t:CDS:10 [Entrophospora sp. SA101]CAJ0757443.1 23068_t:CDS:10 [Entrophospora sp. SA101]
MQIIFFLDGVNCLNSTIQFSETQHNLIAYDLKTYEDGTILIHLDLNNENCTQPILYFRLYFTNGTLINLDIDVTNEIPGFNFCKIYSEGVYQYYLDVYPLVEQYIFVAYLNSSEVPNASVYGLLIDWKGSIWSNNYLNVATVSRDGLVQPPGPIYYSKYLKKNGFLYVGYKSNTNDIIWSHFTMPNANQPYVNITDNGIIEDVNNNSNDNSIEEINFSGYPLAGGGFCLVTTRSIINLNTNKPLRKRQRPKGPPPPPPQQPQQVFTNECLNDIEIDPTKVNFRIDANFLAIPETSNLRNSESNLIFHSPLQDLHVLYIKCNVDYSLGDNLCQLFLIKGANKSKPYNLKISFTSSGNLKKIGSLDTPIMNNDSEAITITPLIYGGYLLNYHDYRQSLDSQSIYGYILNAIGNYIGPWPLQQPMKTMSRGSPYDILPNGTIVAVVQTQQSSWTLVSSNPSSVTNKTDLGKIYQIYPEIDSIIPYRNTELNITYSLPVKLSINRLNIYQLTEDGYNLRLTISAHSDFCHLSIDSLTVAVKVLQSTFNQPSTDYFIAIDSDFVRANETHYPIEGIQKNVWKFKTGPVTEEETNTGPIDARLRLNTDGTNIFNSLAVDQKDDFINNIIREMANMIPVSPARINSLQTYTYDTNDLQEHRLAFFIRIERSNDTFEMNSEHILDDIYSLINATDNGPIPQGLYTKYLDSDVQHFGFNEEMVIPVIGFSTGVALVGIVFLGDYGSIFKFLLSFVSMVLNIAFITFDGLELEILFIPSMATIIIPIIINLLNGLSIMIKESNQSESFRNWLEKNIFVATIFTGISFVDIYSLRILSSRAFQSKESFCASYSVFSRRLIYFIGLVNFIIKEIPQFFIQAYYQIMVETEPSLISVYAFLITTIVLSFNLLWIIYLVIKYVRYRPNKSEGDQDADEYGSGAEKDDGKSRDNVELTSGKVSLTSFFRTKKKNTTDPVISTRSIASGNVIFESDQYFGVDTNDDGSMFGDGGNITTRKEIISYGDDDVRSRRISNSSNIGGSIIGGDITSSEMVVSSVVGGENIKKIFKEGIVYVDEGGNPIKDPIKDDLLKRVSKHNVVVINEESKVASEGETVFVEESDSIPLIIEKS